MFSLKDIFGKNKAVLAVIFSALIICFVVLGWLNHMDFIKAVVKESEEKLLLLAKTQAQSLTRHAKEITSEEAYVQSLAAHVARQEKFYVLILDHEGSVIVAPKKGFLGNNIFGMLDAINADLRDPQARHAVSAMVNGGEGTAVFNFWTQEETPKVTKMMMAYSPLRIKDKLWSLAVFEEYKSLYSLVEKNTRDNLIIFIAIMLVFYAWGYLYSRIQKEKTQLETTAVALDIINKQLHLQAYEGHHLEQKIKKELRGGRSGKGGAA